MKDHIVLIGADGAALPADSTDYVAIHNTKTGVMEAAPWGEKEFRRAELLEKLKDFTHAGFNDWSLAPVEQLFLMGDRTRFNPAVDPEEHPFITSGWYHTGTVDPESPSAFAFYVYFSHGTAHLYGQSYRARALLVRSAAASASQ